MIRARLRVVLLGLALLVAGGALAPRSAVAATPSGTPYFGFNDWSMSTYLNDIWYPTGYPNRGLSFLDDWAWTARAGANTIRMPVDWRWAEAAKGTYNWGGYGWIYDGMISKGIRPIVTVMYAPDWARHDGCVAGAPSYSNCTGPPDDNTTVRSNLQQFLTKLVQRMPKLAAVEYWNEPNLGQWSWGGKQPDPARYTRNLCAAYAGVKAVDPTLPVLTGGIAGALSDGTLTLSLQNFLNGIYNAGGANCFDAVGYHSYTGTEWIGNEQLAHATRLQIVRNVLAAHGQSNKHIWMTEAGYSGMDQSNLAAGIRDEAEQADALTRTYNYLASQPKVDAVVIHTLLYGDAPSAYEGSYSVLKRPSLSDWAPQPKLAYCALAQLRTATCNPVSSNAPALPAPPACSDGRDNDRDGKTDYPDDPGCTSRTDTTE